jgi:DNA-binding CsgD family transcriptional regulator
MAQDYVGFREASETAAGRATPCDRVRAMAIERARTESHRMEEFEANTLWVSLVEGRLKLVERFEFDNRRYFVVRTMRDRNGRSALAARERALLELLGAGLSNKEVGYVFDVGASSCSDALRSLMEKLGVASRGDLTVLSRLLVRRPACAPEGPRSPDPQPAASIARCA